MKRVLILGAGGQAREIEWLIRELAARGEAIECGGYVTADEEDSLDERSFDALAVGVGDPRLRLKIAEKLARNYDDTYFPPLIHPSATYDARTCSFGPGVIVSAAAVLTVDVTMERFALANFGCTIGHDSRIGAGAVINPGANVSGHVTIGRGALVGTGAQVLQTLAVGEFARVGAGAVVTRNVDAGLTVIGCPARPVE